MDEINTCTPRIGFKSGYYDNVGGICAGGEPEGQSNNSFYALIENPPVQQAREVLGKRSIFFNAHNLAQAIAQVAKSEGEESYQPQDYIAVLGLDCSKGISREICGALSDKLRTEVVNSRKYKIIDRAHHNKILKEWKFQLSDYTTDKVVKMGEILNVGHIVVGRVRQLEKNTCYMSIEMIN